MSKGLVLLKKLLLRKAVIVLAILLLLFLQYTTITSIGETITPVPKITLEDTVRDFTPGGFTPKADINIDDLRASIQYVAIKKSDSSPVSFPIVDAGEYYIRAFIPATDKYPETEKIASLIIKPVEVKIIVERVKEKYNGISNPPKWKLEPEWTSAYIDISQSYYAIESYESAKYNLVEYPKDLGLYYTILAPKQVNKNFVCNSKVFVYEIGENVGELLTPSEASAVVPSNFKCRMDEVKTVYNGNAFRMPYEPYPAIANYQIEYKKVDYTGTNQGTFTTDAPTEPGEYQVRASIFGQAISESYLFIDKITPSFKIDALEYTYSPLGIIPKVTSLFPNNIKYTVNAYLVNDGKVSSSKSVEIPIKNAGKYLIIVNPTDLKYYKSVFASEYITIKKAKPTIIVSDQVFMYDGVTKTPSYTVLPEWAEVTVNYFKIDDRGTVTDELGTKPPIYNGDYHAVFSIAGDNNIEATSVQIKISITDEKITSSDKAEEKFMWLGYFDLLSILILIGLPLLLIGVILVFIMRSQKTSIDTKDSEV